MKPVIFAFIAAAFWGLWWIPIRWLASHGLDGALGGLVINAGAALACVVWAMMSGRTRRGNSGSGPQGTARISRRGWIGAVLVSIAFTTYSAALNYSDVTRVILLFYLAPAWSKIIERVFLGIPWLWTSTLALVTAFSGAVLLLGGPMASGSINIGDAIAVFSGISWSAGSALIFACGRGNVFSLGTATVVGTVVVSLMFVVIDGTPWPGMTALNISAAGLLVGVIYVLPMMLLTLWSAQRLPPATLAFLLTAELLVGTLSAALLLDEEFGPLQIAGGVLIMMAALTELFFKPRPVTARP